MNKWMGKNSKPKNSGWFYVKNIDGSISIRNYDRPNDAWWYVTAWDGFTPNDSFVEWLRIKELH